MCKYTMWMGLMVKYICYLLGGYMFKFRLGLSMYTFVDYVVKIDSRHNVAQEMMWLCPLNILLFWFNDFITFDALGPQIFLISYCLSQLRA